MQNTIKEQVTLIKFIKFIIWILCLGIISNILFIPNNSLHAFNPAPKPNPQPQPKPEPEPEPEPEPAPCKSSADCNEDECEECEGSGKSATCVNSLNYKIIAGGAFFDGVFYQSSLEIHRDKPSPVLSSPQSLYLNSITATFLTQKSGDWTSNGEKSVTLYSSDGKVIEFKFPANLSTGFPQGSFRSGRLRLELKDDKGKSVLSNPTQLYLSEGKSAYTAFDSESGEAMYFINSKGRMFDFSFESSKQHTIYNEDVLRQIRSVKGIVDIYVIDEYKYEIRFYYPYQ